MDLRTSYHLKWLQPWVSVLILLWLLAAASAESVQEIDPGSTGRVAAEETTCIARQIPGRSIPETISFYRLRIKYSTTSDRAALIVKNPAKILTARVISVNGNPNRVQANSCRLALRQPLNAAKSRQRVGVTVDYALTPAAVNEAFKFIRNYSLDKPTLPSEIISYKIYMKFANPFSFLYV